MKRGAANRAKLLQITKGSIFDIFNFRQLQVATVANKIIVNVSTGLIELNVRINNQQVRVSD